MSELLLAGAEFAAPATAQPSHAAVIDALVFEGLPFHDLTTIEEFRGRLGPPRSASARAVDNLRTWETDTLHHWVFDGLVLDILEMTRGHGAAILTVELSNNRWRFPAKIRIGDSRSTVLDLLGKPAHQSDSEWRYVCSNCVFENTITLKFAGEKVDRMRWDFELD